MRGAIFSFVTSIDMMSDIVRSLIFIYVATIKVLLLPQSPEKRLFLYFTINNATFREFRKHKLRGLVILHGGRRVQSDGSFSRNCNVDWRCSSSSSGQSWHRQRLVSVSVTNLPPAITSHPPTQSSCSAVFILLIYDHQTFHIRVWSIEGCISTHHQY